MKSFSASLVGLALTATLHADATLVYEFEPWTGIRMLEVQRGSSRIVRVFRREAK